MKKFIGKNKNGEIIIYEEVKDIKELGNVKEINREKELKKEKEDEDFKIRTDFFNYWLAANWDINTEIRYQGARFFWFLITFPFIFINRLFLIIFAGDWGDDCENGKDFLIKKILPLVFICFLIYWIPGKFFMKHWNEAEQKQQQKELRLKELREKSMNNKWAEEAKRRREENGEIYLGPEIGWYKVQGLPENFEPKGKMNDFANPPMWND